MIPIAPHITAFLQQRLPVERRASGNTCDSYAYAFKLLFEYASDCLKNFCDTKLRQTESHSSSVPEVCLHHLSRHAERPPRGQLSSKVRATALPVAPVCRNSGRAIPLPQPDVFGFRKFHPRFNARLQFSNHDWDLTHAV